MKKIRSVISLLVLTMLLSIILCGCGDEKKNSNNISDVNVSSSEPMNGGSVVVGIQQDLDSLDPHKAVAAGTKELLFNVYEGLVKPDATGDYKPAVASDFTIEDKEYTFTLREGIAFHNGDPVTVEDIKYSIDRCAGLLKDSESEPLVSAFSIIKNVEIIDDATVKIVLKEADTELLPFLNAAIIPKDSAENKTFSGTGPFQELEWKEQESYTIIKNENYWGTSAYLDEVVFKVVANANTATAEMQAGTIDIYPYMTDEQAAVMEETYQVLEGNMNLVQAVFLNNAKGPLKDADVRRAICYALNRHEINAIVAGGRGHIIGTGMFSGFTKYYQEELTDYYIQDVEKAKELLKKAGYESGFDLTITVPSNYQFHVDTSQVVVEQLKQIGIRATIQQVEWATWLSDVYQGRNYEATVVGLDSTLAPKDMLGRFYQSDSEKNFLNYSNSEYDAIYAKAVATTDDAEKVEYYGQLQQLLTEDAASAYIMDPPLLVAMNPELDGYTFYPLYVMDMAKIYYRAQ